MTPAAVAQARQAARERRRPALRAELLRIRVGGSGVVAGVLVRRVSDVGYQLGDTTTRLTCESALDWLVLR